ncbi:hypothetical protein [Bifidobacterium sp.]|nr:hypothetical protein [Bifidobacterium sp.]
MPNISFWVFWEFHVQPVLGIGGLGLIAADSPQVYFTMNYNDSEP